jgi:hypothetical protein
MGWAMSRWRQRVANYSGEIIDTALLASLLAALLSSVVGVLTLLTSLRIGPPVGQILTFGPYDQPAPVWQVDATRLADHRRCVLKPALMAAAPGSMVVERRLPDSRTYQVHWIGGPTSEGDRDCGRAVDLILGLPAMQTLVNADAAAWHLHGIGS